MQFQFSFKHMESSPALQSYAEEKIKEKILKFASKPIDAHVIFSVDRHQHKAHLSLKGGDGFNVEVEHTCGDMYGSVDMLVDKLNSQLKKQKDKLKDHKNPKLIDNLRVIAETTEIEVPIDADDLLKYEEARKKISAH